jgi:ABC-type sulfate transport system permease subunit
MKQLLSLPITMLGLVFTTASAFAQDSDRQIHAEGSPLGGFVGLIIAIVVIAGIWKMFSKAGEHGWAAIVPIYNAIVMLKVAGKPLWWIILLIIPFVNIIVGIIVAIAIAKAFGKGGGFAVGLIFLPFIFYPILGFGSAAYVGPKTA